MHSTHSRVRCPSLVDASSSSGKSTVPSHRTYRPNYPSSPRPPTPTSPSSHHHRYPSPIPPLPRLIIMYSSSSLYHAPSTNRCANATTIMHLGPMPKTHLRNTPPPPSTSTASTPPPGHTSFSTTRSLLRVKPSTRRDRAYLVRDHKPTMLTHVFEDITRCGDLSPHHH